MQTRMDKYNTKQNTSRSRTQKNQVLYESVRNSALTDFNVNSNMSVIDSNANNIDINKIRKILDKKYNENEPKRRSIEIETYDEPVVDEPLVDTKEYDINAVLKKAKQGKNVDYNKERLKKVHETQYEILNNLDLELKKVEQSQINNKKAEEDNLMELINTITQLELKNKNERMEKESSESINLFEDLTEPEEIITESEEMKKNEEESKDEVLEENRESHIEQTLSKLNIDLSSYDDFSDISKRDKGAIIIKIVIFVIIIGLVIGAVYILNNILDLGLF